MLTLLLFACGSVDPAPEAGVPAPTEAGQAAPPPIAVAQVPVPPAPCVAAWEEAAALATALAEVNVHGAAPPDRDAFVEGCELLPESARPCLVTAWGLANEALCREEMGRVPADVRKVVHRRLSGLRR